MSKTLNPIWDNLSLKKALSINIQQDLYGEQLQINSQDIKPGDIFIAMQGQNSDGHNYVKNALDNGASIAIVTKYVKNVDASKLIFVSDTTKSLESLAMYKRTQSKATFIAITGSIGKTSLKEAAKCLFTPCGKTFASRGNFNNQLGLLLNLASMHKDTEYAIFELGMNNPNELRTLTNILKPNIAIINNVYNTHLANFIDLSQIAEAKAEIIEGLDKTTGMVILPKDNEFYSMLHNIAQNLHIKNIYDFSNEVTASAMLKEMRPKEMLINILGDDFNIKTNDLAYHHLYNFIPVLLCAHLLKCDMKKAIKGLDDYKIYPGRGNIIYVNKENIKYSIIDDSYNSSPASLTASIKHLDKIQAHRKIIIIGDMLELGKTELSEHEKFASILNATTIDLIITYGKLASSICPYLTKHHKSYSSLEVLKKELYDNITNGDIILIKASKAMKLNEIIKYLTQ